MTSTLRLAAALGAFGGALIGANIGRGVQHRVQMQNPPGRAITVNAQGAPRA